MERWLTKPRVIVALCAVLLVAAFNRADPMVYGLFLFLATVGILGYALPWLSLRGTVLERSGPWPAAMDLVESQAIDLGAVLRHSAWWPAWVVEVEARWVWASRQFVSRSTVPVLRAGRAAHVLDAVSFQCRGRYMLKEIRLRSGFPLGLVVAERVLRVDDCAAMVRPMQSPVLLPGDWTVSSDPTGNATTRHLGDSLELNMLRPYEPGTPVGRIDWRASARAGELIVQHYEEAASVFVRLVVQMPGSGDISRPDSPGEHCVRAGAAVCGQLDAQRVRFALFVGDQDPVSGAQEALVALATEAGDGPALRQVLVKALMGMTRGQQLVVVVPVGQSANVLLAAANDAVRAGGRLCAVVATWQGMPAAQHRLAEALRNDLEHAGLQAWLAWP